MAEKGPRPPIPVHVLTGFLGAGKTTLLSRHLKSPALAGTAVIVNEFGEIGLDHLLVETADEKIVELSGGCLCCQVRGDLVATLEDLLRRRDNQRVEPFRRVVIETTGLADPAPVMHALMLHPYLALRYALSSVITVVDAVNAMPTLDRHLESVRQVAAADRLVISKSDLLGPDAAARLGALSGRLRAINASAPIAVSASAGDDLERTFGMDRHDPRWHGGGFAAWLRDRDCSGPGDRAESRCEHERGDGHAHDHARHDDRIASFAVRDDRAIGRAALDLFLDLLRQRHGAQLLRVKGIVKIAEHPDRPLVIHGVQHVFHPPALLDAWPDGDRASRIVFITCDGDEAAIAALFDAVAAPRCDAARDALEPANPLATPGGGRFRPR